MCDDRKCGTKTPANTCKRCGGPTHAPSPESYKFHGFPGEDETFPARILGEAKTPLWLWLLAQTCTQKMNHNDGRIEFPQIEEEAFRARFRRNGLKHGEIDIVFLCIQGIVDGSTKGLSEGRKHQYDERRRANRKPGSKPSPRRVN